VLALVRSQHEQGRTVAAVCAAPMVLAAAGIVSGVKVTSHPSVRGKLGSAEVLAAPRVVRSGRVITSQGPGTAIEFALALVVELVGQKTADDLARAMLVHAP
jgi:putative intracellular protease/amidase